MLEEDAKLLKEAQKISLKKCSLLRSARFNCPWVDRRSGRREREGQSRAERAAYLRAKRQESRWLEEAEGGCGMCYSWRKRPGLDHEASRNSC